MTKKTTGRRGRRKKTEIEVTEAEWEILNIVWEKEPCAAGTVQEALIDRKDWAYTTVKLTMNRMVKKGFLEIEKIRNLHLFRACISRAEARRGELRKMLDRAFGGALTPMLKFLIEHEGLSVEETAELRELVKQSRKRQKSAKVSR
jgi:BlaI family penicillinase repressor